MPGPAAGRGLTLTRCEGLSLEVPCSLGFSENTDDWVTENSEHRSADHRKSRATVCRHHRRGDHGDDRRHRRPYSRDIRLARSRFATLVHVGAPPTLLAANGALPHWAAERDLAFDMSEIEAGQKWGCRLEVQLTNPAQEPDVTKWQTQLAFRLAD